MTKHTINLGKDEIKIVKVVQAVKALPSIDKAIGFIINRYAEINSYSKFINDHQANEVKKE